jgi:hypothetical protein
LAECARRGLEGIVLKRKEPVYRSDPLSGRIEVKTKEWRARAKLFDKTG